MRCCATTCAGWAAWSGRCWPSRPRRNCSTWSRRCAARRSPGAITRPRWMRWRRGWRPCPCTMPSRWCAHSRPGSVRSTWPSASTGSGAGATTSARAPRRSLAVSRRCCGSCASRAWAWRSCARCCRGPGSSRCSPRIRPKRCGVRCCSRSARSSSAWSPTSTAPARRRNGARTRNASASRSPPPGRPTRRRRTSRPWPTRWSTSASTWAACCSGCCRCSTRRWPTPSRRSTASASRCPRCCASAPGSAATWTAIRTWAPAPSVMRCRCSAPARSRATGPTCARSATS